MKFVRELFLWQIVIVFFLQMCWIEKIDANVTNKAVAVTRTTPKWTSTMFLAKQNTPTNTPSIARTMTRALAAANSLCLNNSENTWNRSRIINYLINNNILLQQLYSIIRLV